jgi:protocatechuate 3,4-dioxygenase beta subunit
MTRSFASALGLGMLLISINIVLPARGQGSTNSNGSIAGIVIKEPGSEPLKKVLIQCIAEDQNGGGNYTTSTDADGRFKIENIVPGRYRIFFERASYVEVNDRGLKADVNVLTIQAGKSTQDLLFRMLPTAVVSGRITDEDGDPLSEVRVMAQRKKPGKAAWEGAASSGTNDLGEYRLSGLFPGQYRIVAIPAPDFRDYESQHTKAAPSASDSANVDGPSASQPETRYLTTYYPGTYDAMQASAVALKAGDEMPISLTLVPARTYRVRGIVAGIPTGLKANVELISKAGDSIRASDVGADGQFEIPGVGPGSYVLKVSSGTEAQSLTARQEISVVAADIDGVKMTPQPSFTLSGHLRIEGSAGDFTQYSANLRQSELPEDPGFFMSPDSFGANAPIDRQGNFSWKNVNPGNYIVQLFGGNGQNNFFLKSVTLGGRDISGGFTAGGPAMLDLVMSTKGATLEGTVVEKEKDVDNNHIVANATVVAVPEEKYRKIPDHFGSGSTDQHGAFTIRGLSPGSYTLYAWQDVEESEWRDPDFLKSQEMNGITVKVDEGSDQKLDLKLSPTGDDWR